MGLKVGGIDLANSLIDAEFRISVLERIIEKLINQLGKQSLTQEDIERFKEDTLKQLQKKYPEAGISRIK
jgi:hypothetical protein